MLHASEMCLFKCSKVYCCTIEMTMVQMQRWRMGKRVGNGSTEMSSCRHQWIGIDPTSNHCRPVCRSTRHLPHTHRSSSGFIEVDLVCWVDQRMATAYCIHATGHWHHLVIVVVTAFVATADTASASRREALLQQQQPTTQTVTNSVYPNCECGNEPTVESAC